MTDKFAEFMINAAWDAVLKGYESKDLNMVESAVRHIRLYQPIHDDPTPAPVQEEEPSLFPAEPVEVEASKKFPNINWAMTALGLKKDALLSTLKGHIARLPTGTSINRRQLCPILESAFPVCKGVIIGESQNDFSLAFLRAVTNKKNTEDLAAIGVVNGPDGNLIVKCSPQNVSQFTNGHKKSENLLFSNPIPLSP